MFINPYLTNSNILSVDFCMDSRTGSADRCALRVARTQWVQLFVATRLVKKLRATQMPLATQFANKYPSEIIQNSDAVFRRYHFGQRVCCGFLRRPLFFVLLKLNLGAPVILCLVHQPPLIYQTGF